MSESDAGTRQMVRDLVIEKGPVTSGALAKILGLTTAAIRRHITTLEEDGEITEYEVASTGPRGRGRPARYYIATDSGRGKQCDGHADIALKALAYIEKSLGMDGINAFFSSRSREVERQYLPIVDLAGPDPLIRAQALADALTEDGYAASIRPVGKGDFAVQLCQGHCPLEKVASQYPQLCKAELAAFSKILGVHVQRLSTLAAGGHVCTTHVPIGMPIVHPAARKAFRKAR